ncbi:helix-turn-helix domain-containing protein [Microbispora sp. RL4-1S]|uniref:Helix-turn-helix domain-containing protein n=1 Tax=Microbispora oryzae TaxID=2806554 RepID=A0A940WKE2_9ACTN|nr:helix-turn-helix domain-containing protein [Microbispora oryzae]MBP2702756.1 helix-turn-helix domain-containing protein [Microbispora oryzae]
MSVGADLAEARQRAQLTVEQLSQRTHIREAIIEGVERDDFSVCGGDFYIRGHLRAIASALGLDPEAVVREYEQTHGAAAPEVRASAMFHVDSLLRDRGRRASNWTVVAAVAAGLILVVVLVRLLSGSAGKAGETAVELPVVKPKAGAHQAKAHGAAAGQVTAGMVVLKVHARKPSWITVKDAKGKALFEGTLPQGADSTYTAKGKLKVMFADAGAVRLELNGKDLGAAGRDGESVRRTFAAGGPGPR